jgi:hypothetical protein
MPTKLCSLCGADKPHSDFSPRKAGRLHLNSWCKKCVCKRVCADDKAKRASGWKAPRTDERRAFERSNTQRVKLEVLSAYSDGTLTCYCCGESETSFLTIEHLNNDGNAHRTAIGYGSRTGGYKTYAWLKRNGYPRDLGIAVACYNCNCGRQTNGGTCPHKASVNKSA